MKKMVDYSMVFRRNVSHSTQKDFSFCRYFKMDCVQCPFYAMKNLLNLAYDNKKECHEFLTKFRNLSLEYKKILFKMFDRIQKEG